MAIVVEHDKRKHEILQKSLDVFIDEGYEDATFQKIADRCGITRTTLYIYFKNKYEIFLGSIKELLSELELNLTKVIETKNDNSKDSLIAILTILIDSCEENKKLFSVLLNYLLQIKKSGVDPNERVLRRVIRIRHLMSTIVIKGIRSGEFREVDIRGVNEMLYGLMEAAVFRIAVMDQQDISDIKRSMIVAVESLVANN